MVKRSEFGDGLSRYELLAEGDESHHHRLICTECASVVAVEDCELAGIAEPMAAWNGFRSVTHHPEFFGVCPGVPGGDAPVKSHTGQAGSAPSICNSER